MYADKVTRSMQACIDETGRRRAAQLAYNEEHGITPESVRKSLRSILEDLAEQDYVTVAAESTASYGSLAELQQQIEETKQEMLAAAGELAFEKAAELRDRLLQLEKDELKLRGG